MSLAQPVALTAVQTVRKFARRCCKASSEAFSLLASKQAALTDVALRLSNTRILEHMSAAFAMPIIVVAYFMRRRWRKRSQTPLWTAASAQQWRLSWHRPPMCSA